MKWQHLFCDDGDHSSFVEGHVELTPEFIAEAESVNAETLAEFDLRPQPEHFYLALIEENEDGFVWDVCAADADGARPVTGYYWFP